MELMLNKAVLATSLRAAPNLSVLLKMNHGIAIGFCAIGSFIAAFFLFAIAFNTHSSDLRAGFTPVYIGMMVVCLLGALIAPNRIISVLFAALVLPILMLIYIATQVPEYFIDAIVLSLLGCTISFLTSRLVLKARSRVP